VEGRDPLQDPLRLHVNLPTHKNGAVAITRVTRQL
jgi:hypothetical protein